MTTPIVAERCSLGSVAKGEPAIGTAKPLQGLLAIEMVKPWPRDAWDATHAYEGLPALLADIEDRDMRAQALVPDTAYTVSGLVRVIFYQRGEGQIAQYDKQEYLLPAEKVTALTDALLNNAADLPAFAEYQQETAHIRELLVCTHGSRDTCCGSFGYPIYQALRHQHASDSLRVWRTSHVAGHRFAPTLIDMPRGHYWGRVTTDLVPALVEPTLETLPELFKVYRGWSGLSNLVQQAEPAVWRLEGMDWLAYQKTGTVLSQDEAQATVQLDFTRPDGSTGQYQVELSKQDQMDVQASCGSDKQKTVTLYRVEKVTMG